MALRQKWQRVTLLVVGTTIISAAVNAGFLGRLNFFKNWSAEKRVDTLMITGNYAKSRLLAELVQHQNKQPILLLSPVASGDMEIYFLPSSPEAMALSSQDYLEFVDFLKPKQIVVIGNETVVPKRYIQKLQDKFPTIIVASDDWLKNAEALATMFDYKKLERDYSEYLLDLAAPSRRRPAGMDGASGAVMEPAAMPQSVLPLQPFDD